MKTRPRLEALSSFGRSLGRLGFPTYDHLLREAAVSLWRSRMVSLFSVGIIGLSLSTVGGFLLVSQNLARFLDRFRAVEFSLYLKDAATPTAIEACRQALATTPGVVAVGFISKTDALALFKDANPALASVPATLGTNPFPASFEVRLEDSMRDPETVKQVTSRLSKLEAVDSVGLDADLVARLGAARRVVAAVGFFLGGILVLAALFTVANVVKLTAYAHRDEIEIMKLVGATTGFVRGTYVVEGLLQGLAGGTLGVGVLYLGYKVASNYLRASSLLFLASLTSSFLSAWAVAGLIVGAAVLGMLGAALSLGRYVRL